MNFHNISLNEENYKLDLELCRMNGDYVCSIPKDFITNLNIKFNEVSSIDLAICRYYANKTTGKTEEYIHYKDFDSEMILNLNYTHSFIIKNIDEEESVEHGCYKKIKANDLSILLQKTDCVLKDQAWEISNTDSVMDEFSAQTMGTWTWSATEKAVREDPKIGISNKYRFFGLESNWLVAFNDTLANTYGCLFLTDSYNKHVTVITEEEVSDYPKIFLEMGDFIKSVNIRENKDNYVTRLRVTSSNEDISINSVNPYGNEYVEHYDEKTRSKMSEELKSALNRFDIVLSEQNLIFLTAKNELSNIEKRLTSYSELQTQYNESFKVLNSKRTEYFKEPVRYAPEIANIASQIKTLEAQMATNLSNIVIDKTNKQNVENIMGSIAEKLNKATSSDSQGLIFPKAIMSELFMFNQCGSFNDEVSLTNQMLYENALIKLKELQTPVEEFDVNDISAFIEAVKCRNGESWDKVLTVGSLVCLKLKDRELDVRLLEISYVPTSNALGRTASLSLKFSNKPWEFNDKRTNSAQSKQHTSSNAIFNGAKKWSSFELGANYSKKMMEQGLNIAENWVSGRYANSTKTYMDSAGILITDSATEMQSLFLSNGMLAISNDGLKTVKTSITGDGIIGQEIIGKIILGQKLLISSDIGDFIVGDVENSTTDAFGMQIYAEGVERIFLGTEIDPITGIRQAKLRLTSADKRELVISENGIISHNQFQISDNMSPGFPMNTYINMDEGVFEIRKVKLFLKLEKYRAFEKGLGGGGGGTSSSGGAYASTSSDGGAYASTSGGSSNTSTADFNGEFLFDFSMGGSVPLDGEITLPKHKHSFSILINPHSHSMEHQHDITIPDHKHDISIPDHVHEMPEHTHNLQYSIFEDTLPTNVKVYVNDVLVVQNINADSEIDITTSIGLNKVNTVRIESDTNGRIVCNVFSKTFVGY